MLCVGLKTVKKEITILIISILEMLLIISCSNSSSNNNEGNNSTGGKDSQQVITYFGVKPPTVAKQVGDIVFNDGSATPYETGLQLSNEQENAAIAIIFYKGINCSNNNEIRTLGIGLKQYKNSENLIAWCSTDANAYNVDISSIHCRVTEENENYLFSGDKDGSDNFYQISSFLSNNDDTTIEKNYPLFYFAKNYNLTANNLGENYNTGWYIPSIAELYEIYNSRNIINDVASLCNRFSSVRNGLYWSSTQYDSSLFSNDSFLQDSKNKWAYFISTISNVDKRINKDFKENITGLYACVIHAF